MLCFYLGQKCLKLNVRGWLPFHIQSVVGLLWTESLGRGSDFCISVSLWNLLEIGGSALQKNLPAASGWLFLQQDLSAFCYLGCAITGMLLQLCTINWCSLPFKVLQHLFSPILFSPGFIIPLSLKNIEKFEVLLLELNYCSLCSCIRTVSNITTESNKDWGLHAGELLIPADHMKPSVAG